MTDETVVLTGDGIKFFQLASLKGRLKLELKGLKVSRGPTAYSQLKKMGFKGSRESVLQQVTMLVEVHTYDGIELPRPYWPVAQKLEKMGVVKFSEPRGPHGDWIRVTLTTGKES